jgi:4-diphosphocytidyl-2-C-methyl-D-erythritol kinase
LNPRDCETAFAKINLALHVRARTPGGYHRIETLFAFARDGDTLCVEPSDAISLSVSGPFAGALGDTEDNLVVRAAYALREACGVSRGAALRLDKHLPVASGIGGGSADAAAALRLLCRFWELEPDSAVIDGIARALGADVPACMESVLVRGDGRGDALAPIEHGKMAGMPLLLVNPRVAVSTGAVFSRWDGIDRGPLSAGDPLVAAGEGRNDLEGPARQIAPGIVAVLTMLDSLPGVVLSRMSGSGATCFALFENATDGANALRLIAARQPDWWCLETALR